MTPRVKRALRTALATAVLVCMPLYVGGLGARAQGAPVDEYRVKAVFLVTFAKFVRWPPDEGPIVIGIVGDDPFGPHLHASARTVSVNGRRIVVRQLHDGETFDDCEIVFISASESGRTAEISKQLRQVPVLTVGESPRFLRDGGMIRLIVEDDRVRFQINADRAEAAGLNVNSQLLSLAAQ